MSLGSALLIAQSSLAAVSRRTDVVAGNVANANDTNYVRREVAFVPQGARGAAGGGTTAVTRAALDAGLVRLGLDATSEAAARTEIAGTLSALSTAMHGPDGERAPAAALSRLHDALQTWSASPTDPLLGEVTLDAARSVARAFGEQDAAIARSAREIDGRIADDVAQLNLHLETFGAANDEIVRAVRTGRAPPLDAHDRRDEAMRAVAGIVPVHTIERRDGDVMLTTRRGATLFETVPRTVTFEPGGLAGTPGTLAIDGVAVPLLAQAEAPRGRLEAHLHLRDDVIGEMRARNDAAAEGTRAAFATSGLFAATGLPGTGATIEVPDGYDIAVLRNGPPSFADDIIAATEALDAPQVFTPDPAGPARTSGLMAFAAESVAVLDRRAGEANGASLRSARLADVLEEKRVQAGGVDIDVEMTKLLALERSYEASARLLAVADRMLADLMAAVR